MNRSLTSLLAVLALCCASSAARADIVPRGMRTVRHHSDLDFGALAKRFPPVERLSKGSSLAAFAHHERPDDAAWAKELFRLNADLDPEEKVRWERPIALPAPKIEEPLHLFCWPSYPFSPPTRLAAKGSLRGRSCRVVIVRDEALEAFLKTCGGKTSLHKEQKLPEGAWSSPQISLSGLVRVGSGIREIRTHVKIRKVKKTFECTVKTVHIDAKGRRIGGSGPREGSAWFVGLGALGLALGGWTYRRVRRPESAA